MDLSLLWSSRKRLQVTRDFVDDSRAEEISSTSGVFYFDQSSNYSVREMPPSSYTQGHILLLAIIVKKINCFRSGSFCDDC